MVDYTTVYVSGTIYWAKVFVPVTNYDGDGKEWSFDFVPDDVSFLKEHKLLDRLKDAKEPITGDYIHLRKPEKNKEGEKNDPIRIYDEDDNQWESGKLIGNGSKADIKLTVADFGKGKKKALWTKAIRVTEHVPYVSNEFAAMNKEASDEAPKKKAGKKPAQTFDDLDDDMPF